MTEENKSPRRPLKLKVWHDSDIEDPCEYGGWQVHSFSRRFGKYLDPMTLKNKFGNLNVGLRKKLDVGLAFMLDRFEHGACRWCTSGAMDFAPDARWDLSKNCGIALWDGKPKDLGAKTRVTREKDFDGFLESYNDWCNGYCSGYSLKCLISGKTLDSCGGYFDHDSEYMASEILAAVKRLNGVIVETGGDKGHAIQYLDGIEVEEDYDWSAYDPDKWAILMTHHAGPPTVFKLGDPKATKAAVAAEAASGIAVTNPIVLIDLIRKSRWPNVSIVPIGGAA